MRNGYDVDVTVYCITYNHGDYIADMLDGVIKQKANLNIEVCIFDDCSTDNTVKIINEYKMKNAIKIHLYQPPYNLNNSPERVKYVREYHDKYVKGKYIAICEGDDYWIDENKLQIQFDYMEKHPECYLCGSASRWMDYATGTMYPYHPIDSDRYLTEEEVILRENGSMTTASFFMRREILFRDERFPSADVGDLILQLYSLTKGKIYYMDREMCVYRFLHPGSWKKSYKSDFSFRLSHAATIGVFWERFEDYTAGRYHSYVKSAWVRYLNEVAHYDEISFEEYEQICLQMLDKQTDEYKREKVLEIMSVHNAYFGQEATFSVDEKKIMAGNKVIIYGAGDYSYHIERLLKQSGISWDGYMVSDLTKNISSKSLPVWEPDNYAFDYDKTVIIMGLSQLFEDDVLTKLEKYKPAKILKPIWFCWE